MLLKSASQLQDNSNTPQHTSKLLQDASKKLLDASKALLRVSLQLRAAQSSIQLWTSTTPSKHIRKQYSNLARCGSNC